MSDNFFTVPAGWHADPLGLPQLRWWNGEGWTEQVAEPSAPTAAAQEPLIWQANEMPATPPPAPTAPAAPAAAAPKAEGPSLDQLQAPSIYNRVEDPSSYFAPTVMPVLQPGAYSIVQPASPEPEPIPVVSAAYRPNSPRREARYNGYASFDTPAPAEPMARPSMTSESIPVWDIDTEFQPGA